VTLKYIRASSSRGYIKLGILVGEEILSYNVSEVKYKSVGSPLVGDGVSDDAYREICLDDEYYRAKKKALSILSYGDNSKARLSQKLSGGGFSRDVRERVLCEMLNLGYINEERALEHAIVAEVEKSHTGYRKLLSKLMAKGYSRAKIESVYASLSERGEIDQEGAKDALISRARERGYSSEEIAKILYRAGYDKC